MKIQIGSKISIPCVALSALSSLCVVTVAKLATAPSVRTPSAASSAPELSRARLLVRHAHAFTLRSLLPCASRCLATPPRLPWPPPAPPRRAVDRARPALHQPPKPLALVPAKLTGPAITSTPRRSATAAAQFAAVRRISDMSTLITAPHRSDAIWNLNDG